MRPVVVLVTGAGGPAGVSVLRALVRAGHPVVAVDADPLAAGLRLAGTGAVVPRSEDAGYLDAVLDVAISVRVGALVPTVAEELPVLHAGRHRLDAAGVAHWLPEPEAVTSCTDKWRFAEALRSAGVPAPATSLGGKGEVPGPWVVKPRFGRGSRDVHFVDDHGELAHACRNVPEPLVQTRLTGREFTVDALVARDGALVGAVARWRIETRGGISTKGETFVDPAVTGGVAAVLAAVGLEGPANVQGFVSPSGGVSFTEVNPRFSGGLPLSLAAGADLVGEYLRGVLGGSPRPEMLCYREGVRMTRYFEEVFEG